jgi:hypothetical protein
MDSWTSTFGLDGLSIELTSLLAQLRASTTQSGPWSPVRQGGTSHGDAAQSGNERCVSMGFFWSNHYATVTDLRLHESWGEFGTGTLADRSLLLIRNKLNAFLLSPSERL